jgi:hypothetical protein
MTRIQQFSDIRGVVVRHSATLASIDIAIFGQVVECLVLKRIIPLAVRGVTCSVSNSEG